MIRMGRSFKRKHLPLIVLMKPIFGFRPSRISDLKGSSVRAGQFFPQIVSPARIPCVGAVERFECGGVRSFGHGRFPVMDAVIIPPITRSEKLEPGWIHVRNPFITDEKLLAVSVENDA